ncbi:YqaA family protein [Ferrimonas marina]|uniref:Membrane protein YqaA, SNARE-associated domain n=1 Tax=Ferrimonas marina TaxID=299255 RepID=A0A1M5YI07_9GAMM|nr:YqaA family protein [Ferrimonas marina]SHI11657.1 membrane protein YqaA, SNARE-associated domain [Ferrimonas marina]
MSLTLWGLFASAFIAATLAPGGSEAILAYLVTQGEWPLLTLLLVATIGNTLGSMTSYLIGRWIHRKKRPQDLVSGRETRVLGWVERYGIWSLLLAWLPVVGDAIPLLAGWFRFPWLFSTLLIFIGKFLRYLVVALMTLGVLAAA